MMLGSMKLLSVYLNVHDQWSQSANVTDKTDGGRATSGENTALRT